MTDLSEAKQPVNKSNVITLWLLILVFALPPMAAYFMYYSGYIPAARSNKGILIKPTELPELMLKTIDDKPYTLGTNNGKWTLFMMAESACDELCKKNIYLMRQVRTSLGKDRNNTERLFVMADTLVSDSMADFLSDYPNMPSVLGSPDDIKTLQTFFVSVAGKSVNKIFLVDPEGRVMMHYAQDLQPKDLLSDLKRLILVNSNTQSEN